MKHAQCEIMKAYADNTDLVILLNDDGKWVHTNPRAFFDWSNNEFFACLPQHKDNCLLWLNGCDLQVIDNDWKNMFPIENYPWEEDHDFMLVEARFRVKPKKLKRWIAIDPTTTQCTRHYSTKESCFNSEFAGCSGNASGWQFIEIEIEA